MFQELELQLICDVFDEAWQIIERNPFGYFTTGTQDFAREFLVDEIVAAARAGERDPVRLRMAGMLALMTALKR